MATVLPNDENDRRLLAQVHPPDWHNPEPAPQYDLVVIGGGTAGLVTAAGAAGLGARTAIVEQSLLGGDCLNTGCVPSKALLRAARAAGEVRAGASLGVQAPVKVDFGAVMTRLRARRADIARHDSAARLANIGVDVFFGSAKFVGPQQVELDGRTLRFRRAVIASGSRPAVPPIPGIDDVPFLTSETIFSLTAQPRELVILGGGPVGCEMAQAFALLGTSVTIVEAQNRVLPGEDADASALLAKRLARDGVRILVRSQVRSVVTDGMRIRVVSDSGDLSADSLLVATGRAPNVDALSLDAAGVALGSDGVRVDDRLRTTNRRIYAAGDVCSRFRFTHAADAMARIAIQNALFFGRRSVALLAIPHCTFTFPEVAHVMLREDDREQASAITIPLEEVDRSEIDDETDGFVRVLHRRGRILGATIVAPHAGEMIGTIAAAIRHGGTLSELSSTVFPYPTVSMAFRQAGDAFRRSGLTPFARATLKRYFYAWRGFKAAS